MCRNAPGTAGRGRTRTRRGAILGWVAALGLAFPLAAHAEGPPKAGAAPAPKGGPAAKAPQSTQQVTGEVIDVTGLMDRPRGDTPLPWAAPEGFAREPDVTFGRALRDEALTPVDRNELRRLLELERSLGK